MLPKKNRLTKKRDFQRVYSSGRSFFSSSLRLKILPNQLDSIRVAVVVSTKVSKKATKRNRLKRQLLEIVRLNLKKLLPGVDVVISAQPQALKQDYPELEAVFMGLAKKVKLLK